MTEDEALAEYIAAGKALTELPAGDLRAKERVLPRYWRTKLVLFNVRKANGKFPRDTCPSCLAKGDCCENHATCGAFCIHCGFDFR